MVVTLYDTNFVTDLLKVINSEFLKDVAQAIDDEEAKHVREDGQYTYIGSNYYGTGQGSDNFYSYRRDNLNDEYVNILATSIADGILRNRKNAEKFQKKMETQQKKKKSESNASPSAESQNDSSTKTMIPAELEESEYWKKIKRAGLVDDNNQPTISRTEAAVLADILLEKMKKGHRWKMFEKIWKRKNMRTDFHDAQGQVKYNKVCEKFKKILG